MVDPTFGSLSTRIGGVQIRNAAAVAKSALLEQAAERLGVKPEDLKKGPSRPQLHRERLSVPRDLAADCSSLHHHVFGGMTRQGRLGGRSIN
jgi:CO/xanthine dehydrogenase Mo-binding subunit